MIGEELEGFVVTGVLGHGTQGTVFEARHLRNPEYAAAIKILLPHLAADPLKVDRFFDEARAAASIRHPGVVSVLGQGRDTAGRAYIILEKLEGETLLERLRRGPMGIGEAAGILMQLAEALRAAHGHREPSGSAAPIVHRDLKPENVFLAVGEQDARVVVMDFGIAKLSSSERAGGTLSGAGAFGTPAYMAPEQCRGDDDIDHRADLYALGCLLYEMVAGTPPFGYGPPAALLRSHLEDEPPPLEDACPEVPPGLAALCARLLAKAPGERPASCDEVIAALSGLGIGLGVPAPTPRVRVPTLPLSAVASFPRHRADAWTRAWRGLMTLPPWTAAGAGCGAGAVLMGLSTVLGVGDSYLAAPNWGVTYVVLVPLLMMLMLRGAQEWDRAFKAMARRGMLSPQGGVNAVVAATRASEDLGRRIVGLMAALALFATTISVAEWWERRRTAPVEGAFWVESITVGAVGAFVQGLLTAMLITFVVHAVASAQLLHGWAVSSPRLSLRPDRASSDSRRGFELLEQPVILMVGAAALLQLVIYLSNGQSVAWARGESFWEAVTPRLWEVESAATAGGGRRYSSSITLIGSAMVCGFVTTALVLVRSALHATDVHAPPEWPVRWPGLRGSIFVLAASLMGTVFLELGLPLLLLFGAVALKRAFGARAARDELARLLPPPRGEP